jgi:diaminohydroxyphosphoribosylaminopyrimidine deaminase / 5-amino-6-(5-phosphoribosylamino)uracil reductase
MMDGPGSAPRILAEEELFNLIAESLRAPGGQSRPRTLLSWAQGINGSIAANKEERTRISCRESMLFVHSLRDVHGASLIGVSTLLVDDPCFCSSAPGATASGIVVLDSCLRTPREARIFRQEGRSPILIYAADPCGAAEGLAAAGARLVKVGRGQHGVDLGEALVALKAKGIDSLMVEGGAKVLASFLAEGLADHALATIAPFIFDGYPALAEGSLKRDMLSLRGAACATSGRDILLFGNLGAER